MDEHPATEPLRTRSPELLRSRLVDVLIEGEEEWLKDWRDLLVSIAGRVGALTK